MFIFVVFALVATNVKAYEIKEPVILSKETPRYIEGGSRWIDTVKIQGFGIASHKGGYIRLKTHIGAEDCFQLAIYKVPEGSNIKEALPYVSNLPIYAIVNGMEKQNFVYLAPGEYIYVLTSSLGYPDARNAETQKLFDEVQIIIAAKLNGK